MGRRRDEKKREDLARRAFEVLCARGAGVTMSELAKALGLKRSTLYWYFEDMHAIVEAVLRDLLEEQQAYLMERLEGVRHPIDLLYENSVAVHAFFDGREELVMFLLQLWSSGGKGTPERVIALLREFFEPRRAFAVELMRVGIEAGWVEPCEPEEVVQLVGAFTNGLFVERLTGGARVAALHTMVWERLLQPLKRKEADEEADSSGIRKVQRDEEKV